MKMHNTTYNAVYPPPLPNYLWGGVIARIYMM